MSGRREGPLGGASGRSDVSVRRVARPAGRATSFGEASTVRDDGRRNPTSLFFAIYVKCGVYANSLFSLQPFANTIRSKETLSRSEECLTKWIRGVPSSNRNPRGEDADKIMEATTVASGVGVLVDHGCTDARRGAAGGIVPACSDQTPAGPMQSGESGLRLVPARVFRLSPDLLAEVPRGLGLPVARGARCGGQLPEATARSGHAVDAG